MLQFYHRIDSNITLSISVSCCKAVCLNCKVMCHLCVCVKDSKPSLTSPFKDKRNISCYIESHALMSTLIYTNFVDLIVQCLFRSFPHPPCRSFCLHLAPPLFLSYGCCFAPNILNKINKKKEERGKIFQPRKF